MAESVRTFVAVEVPAEVGDGVYEIQERLKALPALHNLRWVDPFDSHITIKFLGDVEVARLPAIVEALDGVAENWEPFEVRLEGLGAFPNVLRPNSFWLGVVEGEKAFTHLYNAVEVALKRVGIKAERRAFLPHLTLARVPREWDQTQRRLAGDLVGPTDLPPVPAFPVEEIALIRSVLTPVGPSYSRLASAQFGETPPLAEDDWEDIP